eukprot:UN27596
MHYIDDDSNFFQMGGDSLMALWVMKKIVDEFTSIRLDMDFGIYPEEFRVKHLYTNPTFKTFSQYINSIISDNKTKKQ